MTILVNPGSIYCCSRASKPERVKMWQEFREEGFNIISSWIDEGGREEVQNFCDLWAEIQLEIQACEKFVLYAEPGDFPLKGALVEAGIALVCKKPILVCLPGVDLEGETFRPVGSWIASKQVYRCDDIKMAMKLDLSDYKPVHETFDEFLERPSTKKLIGAGMGL